MSARDAAARAKRATTSADIHELITSRWSSRAFDSRPIEPAAWRQLFEAARWAPSSANEQPWRFVLIARENTAEFSAATGCLNAGNQRWAPAAAALVVTAVNRTLTKSGAPNRWAWHDMGQAIANFAFQATALGLVVHQMAGFDVDAVRAAVGMPTEFEPVTIVAVGYPGDPDLLAEPDRVRELEPRKRHPLNAFVFAGRWGRAFGGGTGEGGR